MNARRPPLAWSAAVAAAGFAVASGCAAGPLRRAQSDFAAGRYPQAEATLVAVERESRTWEQGPRAEYALYRGLTEAALGDRDRAHGWLVEARRMHEAEPACLSPEDAERLAAAIEAER